MMCPEVETNPASSAPAPFIRLKPCARSERLSLPQHDKDENYSLALVTSMETWDIAFNSIRRSYLATGDARTRELDRTVDILDGDSPSLDALDDLLTQFHKIAGTAASYGFNRVGSLGLEGELMCRSLVDRGEAPSQADCARWRSIVDEMLSEFKAAQ